MSQFDIKKLFHLAKMFYSQEKTFYISTAAPDGIHLGIYTDPKLLVFSEYVFGNTKDMKTIVDNAEKHGIFKSFYCSMCAIEEPDNISVVSYANAKNASACNGTLQPEQNMALKINQRVNYNGIPFLICGTAPQYYYNHLLLSTLDHYSTYMIFENKELFRSVLNFSADLAKQDENAKLVFNGTFGSDIWHFHLHITDTAIAYVDFSLGRGFHLPTESDIIENNESLGVVNYKIVGSANIDFLFQRVYQLTRIVYSPLYIYRSRYLSGVFKTVIIKGIPYYFVFLVTGNKVFPGVAGEEFRMFFPAAALNTEGKQLDNQKLKQIAQSITKEGCYANWSTIDLAIQPARSLRVEFFEQAFRKKCNVDYLALPDIQNVFSIVDGCILKSKSCGMENADTFATYKYAISLIFICMAKNISEAGLPVKGGKNLEQLVYKRLVSDPAFLHHALKSGIAYLTNNYGIKDSKSLFLKGPIASEVFQTSFNNFNLLTSYETAITKDKLTKQSKLVTDWINFDPAARLGKSSAAGIVYGSNLKQTKDIDFIIKTIQPRIKNEPVVSEMFLSEFAAGVKINDLRKKIPNFIITLGGFECASKPSTDPDPVKREQFPIQTLCQDDTLGAEMMNFILLEKITGVSFSDYIESTDSLRIVLAIYQIAAGLYYAQQKLEFTHYDLHADNIMVTPLVAPSDKPVLYKYRFGDVNTFDVPAYVNCSVIDYGSSYVKGLNKYAYPGDEFVHQYGMTIDRPNFNRDIYSIVINTFMTYLATKSGQEIAYFYSNPNPLRYLVEQLFRSYQSIFYPNAFEIIKKEYEKVFSNLTDKRKFLVELLNKSRKDGLYYLYLPKNHPAPKEGLYKSQLSFLKTISKEKIFMVSTNTSNEYRWGDYEVPGCFALGISEKPTKEKEIANLRNFVRSLHPDKTPKPSAEQSRAPKSKNPKKSPKPSGPKPSVIEKVSKLEETKVSKSEEKLLKDIINYNNKLRIERRDAGGAPEGLEYNETDCYDMLKTYGDFWKRIDIDSAKEITNRKDLLLFKRRINLLFHPDKQPEYKRQWATAMTAELNKLSANCLQFL